MIDRLERVPARWVFALTTILVVLIAAFVADRAVVGVTIVECAHACGDRLDYSVRGECSCKPDADAPTLAGLGGHP